MLRKVAVTKAISAAAPGPDPESPVGIFGQSIDAAISETVLLAVSSEESSIESGKASAVGASPEAGVPPRQYSHDDVVRQSVGGREHSDRAVLEPDEPISVCADPQGAISVAIHIPH